MRTSVWIAAAMSLGLASTTYAIQMEPGQGPAPLDPGLEQGTEITRPASTERLGAHNHVVGQITAMDADKHILTLSTEQYGDLILAYQPNDLLGVGLGNQVVAELGLWPGAIHDEPLRRAGDMPAEPRIPKNDRSMTGTVARVDHKTGQLQLDTDKGPLMLAFQLEAIENLKQGDRVTVEMTYNKSEGRRPEKLLK